MAALDRIADGEDFAFECEALVESWLAQGADIASVEPILRFIESHPEIDFGMPGALVHFVESFYRKGYEEKLVESLRRRPQFLTAWMMNRLLNGTKQPELRDKYIAALTQARSHPDVDKDTVTQIDRFLRLHP